MARLTRILGREGANPRVVGMFFKSVVQAVLLLGSRMWVLTPCMGRDLGKFQYGVPRRITGIQPRRREEEGREYSPLVVAMEEARFEKIKVYILKRQNTVVQ